jgi:hypothetical protein
MKTGTKVDDGATTSTRGSRAGTKEAGIGGACPVNPKSGDVYFSPGFAVCQVSVKAGRGGGAPGEKKIATETAGGGVSRCAMRSLIGTCGHCWPPAVERLRLHPERFHCNPLREPANLHMDSGVAALRVA